MAFLQDAGMNEKVSFKEGDSKGGISRLAKMRKPQCTVVHEDFRIKRNEESTLLSHPLFSIHLIS